MPNPQARKTSAAAARAHLAKQAERAKGRGASRPSARGAASLLEVSEQAYELARLVEGQALDQDIAAILGREHLPQMMQRVLHNSLTSGPAAAQATGLIMRLLKHPAASAADKQAADRGRPGILRGGLVGRLTKLGGPVIEGDSGLSGRAAVTQRGEGDGKLPF